MARKPFDLFAVTAALTVFAMVCVQSKQARACYSVAAGKDCSLDGAVLAGHLEQNLAGDYVIYTKVPRQEREPGEKVTLKSGVEIPQVEVTWGFLWSQIPGRTFSDGYLNEWGVSVFSDWCPSRYTGGALTGDITYWLRRLIAERAQTAREGVEIAGALVEEHGYGGDGRTYIVADPDEVWLMAVVNGHQWLAQRVPDDQVAVIANVYTIQEVDLDDTDNFLASPDIITFAAGQGWYDPKGGQPFRFREAYGQQGATDDRQRQGLTWFTGGNPGVDDLDLPFSVMPAEGGSLKPADFIEHLREILNAGTDISRTNEGSVVQLLNWLPPEVGAVHWRTTSTPSHSLLAPWYAGVTDPPEVRFLEAAG